MIKLETLLRKISGANHEVPSILDGTAMTREEAEIELAKWGLSLRELKPAQQNTDLGAYLDDPNNYDIGLKHLSVHLPAGNRILFAEVVVQYKRMPYDPNLNSLGKLLKESGLLEIPETTRDLPQYFPATALIDRP